MFTFFVQAIRHERLNKPNMPCETSGSYDMGQCIERSIISGVGCQPPWRRYSVEGTPLCDNLWSLFNTYHIATAVISNMDLNQLIKRNQCLPPCSYMEFKVSLINY